MFYHNHSPLSHCRCPWTSPASGGIRHHLRPANTVLVIRSLSLQGDPKLYSRIAVDADELIVLELNDIAALVSKER